MSYNTEKISKERWDYSWKKGKEVEEKFKKIVSDRGNIINKSSKEEDIYQHIDFWVNNKGVDVKGSRHLECIWLELKNVNGDKGWLQGESEWIVFDVEELSSFCVFKRIDLLNYILSTVKETTESKKDFLKYYTRKKWNRKDVLVKCRYYDIEHLLIQKLNYK